MQLIGTWVPEDPVNPHAEICHAFVYRWLIGSGKISAKSEPDPIKGPFNGEVMKPILFPRGGQPVRVAGVNKVQEGDIIGFFDATGALVHSMVAAKPTIWVGANNHGCFGTGTGRTAIKDVYNNMARPEAAGAGLGWEGNTANLYKAMGGQLTVLCYTP